MQLHRRMNKAKDALKIFMRSLPTGCFFTIIGFGSDMQQMTYESEIVIPYNEDTMNMALNRIGRFKSDLGGTEIGAPLLCAQTLESPNNANKRVFILTDGAVMNPQALIEQA